MSNDSPKQYWKAPRRSGEESGAVDGPYNDLAPWMDSTEAAEEAPGTVNRRNFLKAAGFTMAGAAAASGCSKAPIKKVLPYLIQPEGVTPGRAEYFASVCGACEAGCGTLVKSRDGRPIKLEGIPGHPVSQGGLCAQGQASLLGLYDSRRFENPQAGGHDATWDEVDTALLKKLDGLRSTGGKVRFLTRSVISPTTQAVIDSFLQTFLDARHVTCDPLSSSAILDAHEKTHAIRALPNYDFSKAAVIVSFDADFLGTWINPVGFAAGYRAGRMLESDHPSMTRHVQFESRMSLTGSNADTRFRIAPEELGLVISHLAARIARLANTSLAASDFEATPVPDIALQELAQELWDARGKSLVVCGSQDVEHQVLCNFINYTLGNYGVTLDVERRSYQRQGTGQDLAGLLKELEDGAVDALFIAGLNPAYELPGGFAGSLSKVNLIVSFAERPDETSALAHYVCPDHHFLESWGDAEALAGVVSLRQPVIRPLRNSRALIESLNTWAGKAEPAYNSIRKHWKAKIHLRSQDVKPFRAFWDTTLHDGFTRVRVASSQKTAFKREQVRLVTHADAAPGDTFTLVLYPKIGIGDGRHAYNPWLQELSDPVSKVTWDNYACLSVATAAALGVDEGDVVRIEADGVSEALVLPVYVQPGQHDKVVAVALGYGQQTSKRFAEIGPKWILGKSSVGEDGLVGKNATPWARLEDGALGFVRGGVKITKTGHQHLLAATQTHHTITVPENLAPVGALRRELIQETTFAAFKKDPSSGSFHPYLLEDDLYPDDHKHAGHHWGMAVDLTACNGCSACVIACQAENNIPVVGKDEVRRRREMHWMRIDRYYSGEGDEIDVAHQPMMCQQCDNASCENVCPVLATVHTEEGLNAQVYNRCVGTRYCENNCAYKVRRFNWFRYRHDDPLENMVLNPDVVVRSRGVMEKCSFCVQRIQEAKIEAKRKGEKVSDEAVQPACQQSCPAQAIVLGDINDPESRISKLLASPRQFKVLEEINVRPSVGYLTLVRNRPEAHEAEGSNQHG